MNRDIIMFVAVQLDLSAVGTGKRRREVQTDEVRMWAAGAGLPDSSLIEVSASDGTDVLAVFHRLIGQATGSASVRRLEPLLRRRLSGNSARMCAARARLRDKTGDDDNGGGQTRTARTETTTTVLRQRRQGVKQRQHRTRR